MNYRRTTIKIPSATAGWNLDAWQYLPSHAGPHPVVVMAHGFCCLKIHALDAYARRLALSGLASLVFDYRTFGDSDGQPRNCLVPKRQVQDYHSAIYYARSSPLFDKDKIGIFGCSQSGGNAFQVAAEDPKLAFGIAQCPYTELELSPIPNLHTLGTVARMLASFARQMVGFSPVYIQALGKTGSSAMLASTEACEGIKCLGFDIHDDAVNKVDATVAWYESHFRPGRSAALIKCPFLCLAGTEDELVPARLARKYIKLAPKGQLYDYVGDHWAAYPGGPAHQDAIRTMIDFLHCVVQTDAP